MARRRLLSNEAWAAYLDPPTADDLDLIGTMRSAAARLGFALTLLHMRLPGRVLEAGELVPAPS